MKNSNFYRIAAVMLASVSAFGVTHASAQIITTPTTDGDSLAAALDATGLRIVSVRVRNGVDGQVGIYRNFLQPPVSIRSGIVLSSGNVTSMGPLPEVQLPDYDPSSPPAAVNSAMDPTGEGGTSEFNAYGLDSNNIENFTASYDVAALEVVFELLEDSAVKFDFIFGSVEFPYWTSQFTDAFIVFLDGTDPLNQITVDGTGAPVQVGRSFAGLETVLDVNTAFSNPHGLIHHLTTTTDRLDAGMHTLIFEVGDVNDQVLDSAVFLAHLRTGTGTGGTGETEDCRADLNSDDVVDFFDYLDFVDLFTVQDNGADFNEDEVLDFFDYLDFVDAFILGCTS